MTNRTIHTSLFNSAFHRALALAAPVCLTTTLQAAPNWDVVGVQLGMSEQQAVAAIKAHAPTAQVTMNSLKFSYNDGAKRQDTAAFTSGLIARISLTDQDQETLELEFSAPPLEQRLISLRRTLTSYANPPALERMMDTLEQKYGKPATVQTYGIGMISTDLAWVQADRKPCGKVDKGLLLPPVSQTPDALRWYAVQQKNQLAPADPSQCSAVLQAKLKTKSGGSSVVSMEFMMTDPGYGVPAMQATSKWLADQEANARKARLNSGDTPKL